MPKNWLLLERWSWPGTKCLANSERKHALKWSKSLKMGWVGRISPSMWTPGDWGRKKVYSREIMLVPSKFHDLVSLLCLPGSLPLWNSFCLSLYFELKFSFSARLESLEFVDIQNQLWDHFNTNLRKFKEWSKCLKEENPALYSTSYWLCHVWQRHRESAHNRP